MRFCEDKSSTKKENDIIKHDLYSVENNKVCNVYLTSTPASAGITLKAVRNNIFSPDSQDHKSVSPITRSTQRMTRAMQVCILFIFQFKLLYNV